MTSVAKKPKTASLQLPSEVGIALPGEGTAWLDSLRQSAAEQFAANGLPTVREEEWRYTDIRKLKRQQFSLTTDVPDVSSALATLPDYGLPRIIVINGYFVSSTALPKGVTAKSLAKQLQEKPESLQGQLGTIAPQTMHSFTALNTAYCFDGVLLEIADNAIIEQPIEIVHLIANTGVVAHPRNLIIAGKLSNVEIIERSIAVNTNDCYLNNSVTEIIAHDGAQLEHYKIQQDSPVAFHMGGVFINQGRNAKVINHNIALGGALVRNDIHLTLLGTGGHGGMNGLVVGHGKQHVHNHTEVDHRVPHCTSDEYYKNVLDDDARAIFRGRIIVAQDAQKTNAEQQNNNLLLSDNAEANCKPQLEIYADDVQCSHGATVGQLDAKSLFYLQSRGISAKDARRLLTFAFVNELLDRVGYEPLRSELTQRFLGELLPDTYQEVFA